MHIYVCSSFRVLLKYVTYSPIGVFFYPKCRSIWSHTFGSTPESGLSRVRRAARRSPEKNISRGTSRHTQGNACLFVLSAERASIKKLISSPTWEHIRGKDRIHAALVGRPSDSACNSRDTREPMSLPVSSHITCLSVPLLFAELPTYVYHDENPLVVDWDKSKKIDILYSHLGTEGILTTAGGQQVLTVAAVPGQQVAFVADPNLIQQLQSADGHTTITIPACTLCGKAFCNHMDAQQKHLIAAAAAQGATVQVRSLVMCLVTLNHDFIHQNIHC